MTRHFDIKPWFFGFVAMLTTIIVVILSLKHDVFEFAKIAFPAIIGGAMVIVGNLMQSRSEMKKEKLRHHQELEILDRKNATQREQAVAMLEQQYLTAQGSILDVVKKLIYRLAYYSNSHPSAKWHSDFDDTEIRRHDPDHTPRVYITYLLFRTLGTYYRYDIQEDSLPEHNIHDSFMYMWERKISAVIASSARELPGQPYMNRTKIDEVSMLVGPRLENDSFSWISFCEMVEKDETFACWVKECTEKLTSGFAPENHVGIQFATRARIGILLVYLIDLCQDLTGKSSFEHYRSKAITNNLGHYWDNSSEDFRKWYLYQRNDMDAEATQWPANPKAFRTIPRAGSRSKRK